MTKQELDRVAYATHTERKSKGAGKGYKYTHTVVWSGAMTRAEYLRRLAEIDPRECGLFLCKVEYTDLMNDRWWDAPDYRATHLQTYRSKITQIRKSYGLKSSDVAEFMRVA